MPVVTSPPHHTQVVTLLPEVESGGRCSDALRSLAGQLLEQEMQRLGNVDTCCACAPPSAADAAAAAVLGSSGSGTANQDGECDGFGSAHQPVLLGRLQLILALVRALDKASEGSPSQQQLIQLLIRSYLFPEAAVISRGMEIVPAAEMQRALDVCAVDPAARKTALDLLCELMAGCASHFELGVNQLHVLHFGGTSEESQSGEGGRKGRRHPDMGGQLGLTRPQGWYSGLRNGGATCYMNSVMQQLFMQPRIRELVLGAAPVEKSEEPNSVFAQLQVLFGHLFLSRTANHNPRHFWQSFRDYDGQPIDIKEHQDAYEFFTRLQVKCACASLSRLQNCACGVVPASAGRLLPGGRCQVPCRCQVCLMGSCAVQPHAMGMLICTAAHYAESWHALPRLFACTCAPSSAAMRHVRLEHHPINQPLSTATWPVLQRHHLSHFMPAPCLYMSI